MAKPMQYIGQGLFYALFMGMIGYFSTSPAYTHLPPDEALIKLSFSHAGQQIGACRKLTPGEIAKLPMYQRAATTVCPRERDNVIVDLEMDGKQLYHAVLEPGGLSHNSISSIYQRIPVKAGNHTLKVSLNDNGGDHYNYVHEEKLDLAPGRILVIDFDDEAGGFLFKNHNKTQG